MQCFVCCVSSKALSSCSSDSFKHVILFATPNKLKQFIEYHYSSLFVLITLPPKPISYECENYMTCVLLCMCNY